MTAQGFGDIGDVVAPCNDGSQPVPLSDVTDVPRVGTTRDEGGNRSAAGQAGAGSPTIRPGHPSAWSLADWAAVRQLPYWETAPQPRERPVPCRQFFECGVKTWNVNGLCDRHTEAT